MIYVQCIRASNLLVLDANNFALGGMIAMLSIKNKVSEIDTEKLKKLKTAIPRALGILFIVIFICIIVMAILTGVGIVNKDVYPPLPAISIMIFLLAFGLADKLDSLIRFELTKRKLMSDSDETDKTD